MAEESQCRLVGLVLLACSIQLLLSGSIFGWPSFEIVLRAEGLYSEWCRRAVGTENNYDDNNNTIISGVAVSSSPVDAHITTTIPFLVKSCQSIYLNKIFSSAILARSCFSIIQGFFVDYMGPQISIIVNISVSAIGCILFGASDPSDVVQTNASTSSSAHDSVLDLRLIGFILYGVGTNGLTTPLLAGAKQLSTRWKTWIVSILSGCFDAASLTFYIYRMALYPSGVSSTQFMSLYVLVPIVSNVFVALFWPRGTVHTAIDMDKSNHNIQPDTISYHEDTTPSPTMSLSSLTSIGDDNHMNDEYIDCGNRSSNNATATSTISNGMISNNNDARRSDESLWSMWMGICNDLWSCVSSRAFLLFLLYNTVSMFWLTMFLGIMSPRFGVAKTDTATIIIPIIGLVFSPVVAWLLQHPHVVTHRPSLPYMTTLGLLGTWTCINLVPYALSSTYGNVGIITTTSSSSSANSSMGSFSPMAVLGGDRANHHLAPIHASAPTTTEYWISISHSVSVIVFSLFRCFHFTMVITYLADTFGYHRLGRLFNIAQMVPGLLGGLQSILLRFVMQVVHTYWVLDVLQCVTVVFAVVPYGVYIWRHHYRSSPLMAEQQSKEVEGNICKGRTDFVVVVAVDSAEDPSCK